MLVNTSGQSDRWADFNVTATTVAGEGCRNTPAIAVKADRTSRRYALAQLDKAVKGHGQRHQRCLFFGPHRRNRAGLFAMRGLPPQREAAPFQPAIQRGKVWELWHPLQHLVTGVAGVLFDLTFAIVLGPMADNGSSQPAAGLQSSGSQT